MLQFFGGSGGAQRFNSTPTAGKPSLAIGNGTFGGGATPNFQGTVALGVNMVSGYANELLDLQVAGVSVFSVDFTGGVVCGPFIVANTVETRSYFTDASSACPYLDMTTVNVLAATARTPTQSPMTFVGAALQTADIITSKDSALINQFSVANNGTGVAPKWSLRVAPIANAESMAQAHVIGAATGRAIQVIDNAGTSLGWIPLYA